MAPENDHFRTRMRAYDLWKSRLLQTIEAYQSWLDDSKSGSADIDLRLFETLEALRSDRLVIAFAGEFARGKTELINAIFFADYQRRLLPSAAGRTTMCPTELFYDHTAREPYIRLLPIETRRKDMSVAEYKQQPIHWTTLALDVNAPDQIAAALQEVVRVKRVSLEEARQLGLCGAEPPAGASNEIEIPVWRHALISFPHPLLQQGLVILDTPGLNALGSEPELTLNALPAAHALLFILATDTGVTQSDMEIWQRHVQDSRRARQKGLMIVLNKIDTLWDELKSETAVHAEIEAQRTATAATLNVDAHSVFPISAQKALLAKIRRDPALLQKSRVMDLEAHLSNAVLPAKQVIVRDKVVAEVGGLIDNSRARLAARLQQSQQQLSELRALRGQKAGTAQEIMNQANRERATYLKSVETFQASRRLMGQQAKAMIEALNMDACDELINQTRKDMADSWTTPGLKHGMKTLFDGIGAILRRGSEQAGRSCALARHVYHKFGQEHGLTLAAPRMVSLERYTAEFERLYQQAETFRTSPVTTMTEQNFVIKKFFISLVSHARILLAQASQDTQSCFK
ncbi:MAG: dynamin family protein, partial [Gammaproteobacteria bacterium]|nr:dynamin family protein [Gammaproteobacteria bacterium]